MALTESLRERVARFIQHDPDPTTRGELQELMKRAEHDAAASTDLEERFAGPLEFGTAGLRGLIGAGLARMNRAVVRRTTWGLAEYVIQTVPDAKTRGIVIGRDGRRMSEAFQEEAASVALARGMRVHLIAEPLPTPVTAFAVRELGAAAGVMITASHNPPQYNGYKVYWENGAQIIPPHDREIAARIDRAPPADAVDRVSIEDGLKAGSLVDATRVVERYLDRLERMRFRAGVNLADLSIAYSALHGVGERTFRRAVASRGLVKLHSVPEQADPDPAFPTLAFPNPEEPGALDRVLKLAERERVDLVLVNDPDADRLGAAVRARSGGYTVLSGNEIGAILGYWLILNDRADDPTADAKRLVMSTIVSSQLLRRIAEASGVRYAETLTGFKWIANDAIALEASEDLRFVFGYEEALGYTVGTLVRDKDGISAALTLAEYAAALKAEGRTLLDALEEIRRRFGYLQTKQASLTLPGQKGLEAIRSAMARLRAAHPPSLGGTAVRGVEDLAAKGKGDVLIFELEDGGRAAVRPSGTEPKIKFYFEVAESLAEGEALEAAKARGTARLARIEEDILALAGLR